MTVLRCILGFRDVLPLVHRIFQFPLSVFSPIIKEKAAVSFIHPFSFPFIKGLNSFSYEEFAFLKWSEGFEGNKETIGAKQWI